MKGVLMKLYPLESIYFFYILELTINSNNNTCTDLSSS